MRNSKSNMIILVLCFIAIGVSADRSLVTTLSSLENYKNKHVYFNHESQKNGSLFYLMCDRPPGNNFSCAIFKEEHFVDHKPRLSTCNVTLQAKYPFKRVASEIRVVPINRVKTLIVWAETDKEKSTTYRAVEHVLKFTIVDFEYCRTTEKGTNIVLHESILDANFIVTSTNFVLYDDSIHVSYYHETLLFNSFRKVRIDIRTGKIVFEKGYWYIKGFGGRGVDIIPKQPHDYYTGYFFIDAEAGNIYASDNNHLSHFPSYNYFKDWKDFRYSIRDRLITVCNEIDEIKVRCDQIDFYGTITKNMVFDLSNRNIAPVPYNLPGGGFLLLTTEYLTNSTERGIYQIFKVGINGQREKLIRIEGFNCDINEFVQWHTFFENDQGNLCASLLCYKSVKKYPDDSWIRNYLSRPEDIKIPGELHVQCFNQSDF